MRVAITYIQTPDNGQELRYTLRSLKNIEHDEVYIIGDKPSWVKNVTYIPHKKTFSNPFLDVCNKLRQFCLEDTQEFIYLNDDIYFTQPQEVRNYYRGELSDSSKGYYQSSKAKTRQWLLDNGHTIKNYEAHAPIVLEKDKLLPILEMAIQEKGICYQWRSLYGNIYNIGGEDFEDMKTKTQQLKRGKIISTQFYTDELNKLFPKKSHYEN